MADNEEGRQVYSVSGLDRLIWASSQPAATHGTGEGQMDSGIGSLHKRSWRGTWFVFVMWFVQNRNNQLRRWTLTAFCFSLCGISFPLLLYKEPRRLLHVSRLRSCISTSGSLVIAQFDVECVHLDRFRNTSWRPPKQSTLNSLLDSKAQVMFRKGLKAYPPRVTFNNKLNDGP